VEIESRTESTISNGRFDYSERVENK
jgi:hypothetical protein